MGFGGLGLACGYDLRIRADPARPEPLSRVKQTGAVMPHGCVCVCHKNWGSVRPPPIGANACNEFRGDTSND